MDENLSDWWPMLAVPRANAEREAGMMCHIGAKSGRPPGRIQVRNKV